MSDVAKVPSPTVSRRRVLAGAAALGLGSTAGVASAAAVQAVPLRGVAPELPRPELLGAVNPALTYLPFDALAFFTSLSGGVEGRYSDDTSGTGSLTPNRRLSVSLPLPVGSVIRQLNVAYQGQPIIEIHRRNLNTPNPPVVLLQQTLVAGGGAKTQTIDLVSPVTTAQDSTYTLQFFVLAGDSIYGATVGYVAPTQAFRPFVGVIPRVLDTRTAGGKLAANEERTVALGFPGSRGAVINITVTETEGGGGFVAVNRAGIAWPGNSSINWSGPDQNIANGVITDLDDAGRITIRGGANRTHVVIDRIGWLV